MFKIFYPLLKIRQREVEFLRRGFCCSRPAIRAQLEHVGRVFLEGYHAALRQNDLQALAERLNQVGADHRGFAYEGAAMALMLQDGFTPGRQCKRFSRFVEGPGRQHIYMLHVGAGWACARLPWLRRKIESVVRKFHPVLGSLAIDGYGFHEGYFHWETALQPKISALSENARHIFYQGLGRSLWFVKGADAHAIAQTISAFAPQFQADAWSGVGLGCAYAGGMDRTALQELRGHAAEHAAALAQGAAFAAKARQLAGNPAAHTELACTALCGMSGDAASNLCDQTLEQTVGTGSLAYEKWRNLLQKVICDRPGQGRATAEVTEQPHSFSRSECHVAI